MYWHVGYVGSRSMETTSMVSVSASHDAFWPLGNIAVVQHVYKSSEFESSSLKKIYPLQSTFIPATFSPCMFFCLFVPDYVHSPFHNNNLSLSL